MTSEEIKNELRRGLTLTKLQRGLALTVKESRDLYKYIEALEQQSCEDCVSRAELNALYAENRPYLATRVSEFGDKLEKLPSVQPVRSKGYWIERTFPYMIHDYKCSECGETIEAIARSNFCPNCGADMRGDNE